MGREVLEMPVATYRPKARHQNGFLDTLLVQLHDTVQEYQQDTTHPRSYDDLTHAVAALLDAELGDNDKIMVADVLISLIKQVAADMQARLVSKLAGREDLPQALLHFLAYEDIRLAEDVLLRSPLLTDTDLIYVIQAKAEEHWRAIARRNSIGDKVIGTLATKEDEETCCYLLQNKTITIANDVLMHMSRHASRCEGLAIDLIHYHRLPKAAALNLYWHVSVSIRKKLGQRFNLSGTEIDKALQESINEFTEINVPQNHLIPTNLMREVAANYHRQGRINYSLLVNALRRRQGSFFVALMEQWTGLAPTIISEIMRQYGGQGMAVIARAKLIAKEDFLSLFMLSSNIANPYKSVLSDELSRATRYYDGLNFDMAQEIMNGSIG